MHHLPFNHRNHKVGGKRDLSIYFRSISFLKWSSFLAVFRCIFAVRVFSLCGFSTFIYVNDLNTCSTGWNRLCYKYLSVYVMGGATLWLLCIYTIKPSVTGRLTQYVQDAFYDTLSVSWYTKSGVFWKIGSFFFWLPSLKHSLW